MRKPTQSGFTIVEIAIVIVIVGILLTAGLIASRGQVSRAQSQEVIQIAIDLQTSVNNFKQRYSFLPGDWVYAANAIPNITAGGTGGIQGDGLITGTLDPVSGNATVGTEIAVAVEQLYQAGMIGKMNADPSRRIMSQFGPVHIAGAAANTVAGYTTSNPAVRNVIIFFNLPCEVVLELDRALDDGISNTGKVRSSAVCVSGTSAARTFVPL